MTHARYALTFPQRSQGLVVVAVNLVYFLLQLGMPNLLAVVNIGLGLWIVVSKPIEIHNQQHQPTRRAHQTS